MEDYGLLFTKVYLWASDNNEDVKMLLDEVSKRSQAERDKVASLEKELQFEKLQLERDWKHFNDSMEKLSQYNNLEDLKTAIEEINNTM